MRSLFLLLIILLSLDVKAQVDPASTGDAIPAESLTPKQPPRATIDQYRIITLDRDTTYVDTSLTIQKEYRFNYLRRDNFGLLPLPNDGQPYNVLQYSLRDYSAYPEIGYHGKHFFYMDADDIRYYSVATPLTELYFKTVTEQGQMLDAFATVNTSERFNFSIAYKGLRSLGKYINQLASAGNFRFTASYNTLNKRYYANAHFTGQDLLNGENGGITNLAHFETEDPDYDERERLNVYLRDAYTMLKGYRGFLDHNFRINATEGNNNLYLTHQVNYERKYFEYNQVTVPSTLDDGSSILRFGDSFKSGLINDQVRYNRLFNRLGAAYENSLLGKFSFFIDDFRYNYYYDRILVYEDGPVAGSLSDVINSIGGQYEYRKGKWHGKFLFSNSISDQPMSTLDANMRYAFDDKNAVSVQYLNMKKVPDHLYNLHQSSFVGYNWYRDFNNEKINVLNADAKTQWVNVSAQFATFDDFLYFSDDEAGEVQVVTPKQSTSTIKYVSLKAQREFRYGKFALDNTLLYQKVDQEQPVLNVPEFVTRNTLYYSDYLFKKALFFQTGVTFSYFTSYHADDYNPVIGEFFVQNEREIGNFPVVDFFINTRIKQTRIFFKAEHFNSSFTGNNFYSTPNYPYRDFIIRFGLVWNFFQ